MTFDKGSLVLIDYTAKIKDTGEVFESTIEEDAKKHSIHEPSQQYHPKLIAVGESWVLKGLDEALATTSVGEKLAVEVSPEKGFGVRDSGKVRMIPLRKLGDDAEKVSIGDTIEVDNKKGIIRYIGSGRVQVDYNHRYAGQTIIYDIDVKKSLDSEDEKIQSLLQKHVPVEDTIQFKNDSHNLDITIPDSLFRVDGLQIIKNFLQVDLFKFVPTLNQINFIETYQNKAHKEKPVDKQESA